MAAEIAPKSRKIANFAPDLSKRIEIISNNAKYIHQNECNI